MHSLFKYLRLKSFWTGKPHNNTSKAAMSLLFGASIPVCIMSVYQLSIVVDAPPVKSGWHCCKNQAVLT